MYLGNDCKTIKRICFSISDITAKHVELFFAALPAEAKIFKFELINDGNVSMYVAHHSFPQQKYSIWDINNGSGFHLHYTTFKYDQETKSYKLLDSEG